MKKIQKKKPNNWYILLSCIVIVFTIIFIISIMSDIANNNDKFVEGLIEGGFLIFSIYILGRTSEAFYDLSYERGKWIDLKEDEMERFRIK